MIQHQRDYDDIPGTYVFDGTHQRKGYALNMFCKSLDQASNRAAFQESPGAYLGKFAMTAEQKDLVMRRDWLALLRAGGNIYYTFKLAILDGLSMQHVGAAMSGTGMTVEDFRQMMVSGGRPIAGQRSKQEALHG